MARRTPASVAMRVAVSSAGGWRTRKSEGGSVCLLLMCATTSLVGFAKESSDVSDRNAPRTSPSASLEDTRREKSGAVASVVRRALACLDAGLVISLFSKLVMFWRIVDARDFLFDLSPRESGTRRNYVGKAEKGFLGLWRPIRCHRSHTLCESICDSDACGFGNSWNYPAAALEVS